MILCNAKSTLAVGPMESYLLLNGFVIDILTVLGGSLCQTLFACCPFGLVVIRTVGTLVTAAQTPVYTYISGVSLVPYHLATIPVFCSHLKTCGDYVSIVNLAFFNGVKDPN